jgi:hypothetical protein
LKEKVMEVWTLASCEANCKGLFETEGLIGGLIRVMGKVGEGFRVAREKAVWAIWMIAIDGNSEVRKGLFEYDGFVDCLLGRMKEGGEVERECAVLAIAYIAEGDMEVKKGLFKHEGLIDGLIEIAGQTGDEYYYARQCAVWAMNNIADGDDEVKAGLFHFPGLMPRIEAILVDAYLNGSNTKGYAEKAKEKIKQSSDANSRMEKEQAEMKSSLDKMRTEQTVIRTEQAAMKSSLTSVQDSLFRVEMSLASIASTLLPPETLNNNDIDRTLVSPPPPTDSTGTNKRSNLAILADNQASHDRNLKKVKKEKDTISRTLQSLEDERTCTVCLTSLRAILFNPCGHLICCAECSDKVTECPFCRSNIGVRTNIFT